MQQSELLCCAFWCIITGLNWYCIFVVFPHLVLVQLDYNLALPNFLYKPSMREQVEEGVQNTAAHWQLLYLLPS